MSSVFDLWRDDLLLKEYQTVGPTAADLAAVRFLTYLANTTPAYNIFAVVSSCILAHYEGQQIPSMDGETEWHFAELMGIRLDQPENVRWAVKKLRSVMRPDSVREIDAELRQEDHSWKLRPIRPFRRR
jgi:hypothetical protein